MSDPSDASGPVKPAGAAAGARPPARVMRGPNSLSARAEAVPGYRPRGPIARSRHAATLAGGGGAETAALVDDAGLAPAIMGPADAAAAERVVDAAVPAFGTIDNFKLVIGDDDRHLVPDVTDVPWRWICALRIITPNGSRFVGTGWLIGPRTVMTAGHCVFLHAEGGFARSIEVISALDGVRRPYGSVVVPTDRLRAPKPWIDEKDTNNDFGALLLDDDLGATTGFFPFAEYDDATLTTAVANISGYPADRDRATRQYFHARTITLLSPRRLFYEIDTYGGQSGSPIWIQDATGQRVAVGVHTTGATTGNSGTRINADVFQTMRDWTQERP